MIIDATSAFDSNAIVRIKMDPDMDDKMRSRLNTDFFRSILPATMNFQFSSDGLGIRAQRSNRKTAKT
jgi:hypothetical protein